MTLREFQAKYPNDDICLQVLFDAQYGHLEECPRCGKKTRWYRVKKRKSFACMHCGKQIYPMANTIFRKTRSPLTLWFYVIYMFAVTKTGVSAKEIQRVTGWTYPSSWDNGHKIRQAMELYRVIVSDSPHLRRQFTTSIDATHHWVSDKYFQYYLAEFLFRYKHRKAVIPDKLIKRVLDYERKV